MEYDNNHLIIACRAYSLQTRTMIFYPCDLVTCCAELDVRNLTE
jgi:hypothetical protein